MSKMCKIFYKLSNEGRKKSLLSGGDGKELQVIETPVTKELLDIETVEVNKDGKVYLPHKKISYNALK